MVVFLGFMFLFGEALVITVHGFFFVLFRASSIFGMHIGSLSSPIAFH